MGDCVKNKTPDTTVKNKVERLTKTRVIISGTRGTKFNRESGRLIGSTIWNSTYISAWTDDDEKQSIEQQRIRREEQDQILLETYNTFKH